MRRGLCEGLRAMTAEAWCWCCCCLLRYSAMRLVCSFCCFLTCGEGTGGCQHRGTPQKNGEPTRPRSPYLVQLLLDFALLLRNQLQLLGVGLGELPAGLLGRALLGAERLARLAVRPDLLLQHLQLHLQELLRVEEPLLVLPLVGLVCGSREESSGSAGSPAPEPSSAQPVRAG